MRKVFCSIHREQKKTTGQEKTGLLTKEEVREGKGFYIYLSKGYESLSYAGFGMRLGHAQTSSGQTLSGSIRRRSGEENHHSALQETGIKLIEMVKRWWFNAFKFLKFLIEGFKFHVIIPTPTRA